MAQVGMSRKQLRIIQLVNLALIFAVLASALIYPYTGGSRAEGRALLLVGLILVNFFNITSSQTARIEDLEKKLAEQRSA